MTTSEAADPPANAEAGPGPSSWPSAPVYDFSIKPSGACLGATELESEVERNFFRHARWCPDGSTVLSITEDRCLRLHAGETGLSTTQVFKQPESILGTVWYPSASPTLPESFCFVASVRDHPVRLIDGTDGRIRATYPIVDHRERFIAPHSMAFNPQGTKLFCGFENAIEVMDIASPGYDNSERLKTTFTRKEKGQKGIISALAFSTDYSGTFAAGSFSSSVCLYSEDTGSTPLQHLEGVVGGGVTQIAFHPLSPTTVYVASRRSDIIQVFDLRDASQPVGSLERLGSTNQRLHFDVDPWGRYLASGDENGVVRIWDLADASVVYQDKLHNDAVGSVQMHPYKPLLLSCSGSRSFLERDNSDSDGDSDSNGEDSDSDESDSDSADPPVKPQVAEASLSIWSFSS